MNCEFRRLSPKVVDNGELSYPSINVPAMDSAVPGGSASTSVAIELGAVPDQQLLEMLAAQWRQLARQQAQVWATMAEIGPRSFVWISPLGRRHRVQVEPVAAPLPAAIPRAPLAAADLDDDGEQPTPTLEPLTRRGRPVQAAAGPAWVRVLRLEFDPDPPPF